MTPADPLTAPVLPAPVLIGCAHGTREPAGRRTMARLRLDVAALRPGLEVRAASVDVQRPDLDTVVRGLADAGRPAVVVPLLLSAGYHMAVDVARAVRTGRERGARVVAAPALGPDPALVDVLADRLDALDASGQPDDRRRAGPVVLAAAGSSDPRAAADVEQVAAALADRIGAEVRPAFLSAARPRLEEVLAELSERSGRSGRSERSGQSGPARVACYLLAEGFFDDRLRRRAAEHGVAAVTAPMAPHPRLADLVLRRYDEAVGLLADPGSAPAAGRPVGGAR